MRWVRAIRLNAALSSADDSFAGGESENWDVSDQRWLNDSIHMSTPLRRRPPLLDPRLRGMVFSSRNLCESGGKFIPGEIDLTRIRHVVYCA